MYVAFFFFPKYLLTHLDASYKVPKISSRTLKCKKDQNANLVVRQSDLEHAFNSTYVIFFKTVIFSK